MEETPGFGNLRRDTNQLLLRILKRSLFALILTYRSAVLAKISAALFLNYALNARKAMRILLKSLAILQVLTNTVALFLSTADCSIENGCTFKITLEKFPFAVE